MLPTRTRNDKSFFNCSTFIGGWNFNRLRAILFCILIQFQLKCAKSIVLSMQSVHLVAVRQGCYYTFTSKLSWVYFVLLKFSGQQFQLCFHFLVLLELHVFSNDLHFSFSCLSCNSSHSPMLYGSRILLDD